LLAVLTQQGLVSLKRVAQDGMRVRASAGASSFRRRARLEEFLQAAREQVEAVKQQRDPEATRRVACGSSRPSNGRRSSAPSASRRHWPSWPRSSSSGQRSAGGHKAKGEPRASTTDPEARKMKMGDGGFRPAYNAQLVTDTESRVIVGVSLTEAGTDYAQRIMSG